MDADRYLARPPPPSRRNQDVLSSGLSKANVESHAVRELNMQLNAALPSESPRLVLAPLLEEVASEISSGTEILDDTSTIMEDCGDKRALSLPENIQECSNASREKELKDSGILHTWWALIQDQLGNVVREVDSLRASNAKIQARLTEDLMQRKAGHAELKKENAEIAQEQKSLKHDMQTAKVNMEHVCQIQKMSEDIQAQSRTDAKTRERIEELRIHATSMDERAARIEKSFQQQIDRLHELVGSLSKDLRKEVDQRTIANDQVVRDIGVLQEAIRNQVLEIDSTFQMLNSKVASLESGLSAVREDGARRQSFLQGSIVKQFGEQKELIQKTISEEIGAERSLREESVQKLAAQLDADGETRRSDIDAYKCQALYVENFKIELEILRTAITQMASDGTAREERIRKEIDTAVFGRSSSQTTQAESQMCFSSDDLAELRNQVAQGCASVAQGCASCACTAIEVKQEMSACFDALKGIITEERKSRKDAFKSLEADLKSGALGCSSNEIKKLVADLCEKEREQAKALLEHVKQISDSDKVMRQRLGVVLHSDLVTKDDFSNEINRLWETVRSKASTTPTIGSFPLPPQRVSVAAAPIGPRNLQPSQDAQGRQEALTSWVSKQSLRSSPVSD